MTKLSARERYEVGRETVLFIPDEWLTPEQMTAITEKQQVTFSARNENSGIGHGRNMSRSIMLPVSYKTIQGGIYVTVKLDVQALPVSRRELDGNKY